MPGPPPKRSDQRRRRNKVAIDRVELDDVVEVPALDLDSTPDAEHGQRPIHPVAEAFYDSLRKSGQARWYEPSDWARARVFVYLLSGLLWSGKPSSMMYAALQKDMDALLVSEAERRRVRMEIERTAVDTSAEDAKVAQMARYRRVASDG